MAAAKKRENALEDVALVAGTQQNLSNLYFLGIYGYCAKLCQCKQAFTKFTLVLGFVALNSDLL